MSYTKFCLIVYCQQRFLKLLFIHNFLYEATKFNIMWREMWCEFTHVCLQNKTLYVIYLIIKDMKLLMLIITCSNLVHILILYSEKKTMKREDDFSYDFNVRWWYTAIEQCKQIHFTKYEILGDYLKPLIDCCNIVFYYI